MNLPQPQRNLKNTPEGFLRVPGPDHVEPRRCEVCGRIEDVDPATWLTECESDALEGSV